MDMEIQEIGRMMYTLRTQKRISQEDLCRRLCSVTSLCRLEAGERRPELLAFNALLERLGKNSRMVNAMLTVEEFSYFVKRRNVEISLQLKEYDRAEEELGQLMEEEGEDSLKRQDIYRLYGNLYFFREDYERAGSSLEKAILETQPEILKAGKAQLSGLWLSEAEMDILFFYIAAAKEGAGELAALLLFLKDYVQEKITDEEVRNYRRAQLFYLIARQEKKKENWDGCYEACEAVVEAEVSNGTCIMLPYAMGLEMQCLERNPSLKNAALRKKQYQALCGQEKYAMAGFQEQSAFLTLLLAGQTSQEKHRIDEVLGRARERKNMTQEKLSEDICTPETLSRIESGKRNPTVKNFYALMEKLELDIGYYNTDFKAKSFETLEKGRKLRRLVILRRFEEAEKLLKEIELEIDKEALENVQYLGFYHAVFDKEFQRDDYETALQRMEELLGLRLEKREGSFQIEKQLLPIEILIFNRIAIMIGRKGHKKEAADILFRLYEYFKEGRVGKELGPTEHGKDYLMVLCNLASYTEESDDLEKAMEYAEEAIREGLKTGIGVRLGSSLITKGFIQERQGKEICLETYRQAYYLCSLYEDFRNQIILKDHVKKQFDVRL